MNVTKISNTSEMIELTLEEGGTVVFSKVKKEADNFLPFLYGFLTRGALVAGFLKLGVMLGALQIIPL